MTARLDILPEALTTEQKAFVIQFASDLYNNFVQETASSSDRGTTLGPAKNIIETMDLIKRAIEAYEVRHNVTEDARVKVVYSHPETPEELEAISIELVSRDPGAFSQGPPQKGKIKSLMPRIREEQDDEEFPNYKKIILGFMYDNIIKMVCWARTSKAALARLLWLEDVMEEYTWFFRASGVNRILYQGNTDRLINRVRDNTFYGYSIDYFVRTEKIRVTSQKTLEQIVATVVLNNT